jgi:hypothetical protein
MSRQVLMPAALMKAQTLTSCEMLPSQVNLGAANCVPSLRPSSGSNTTPGAKAAIVVPSLGATL